MPLIELIDYTLAPRGNGKGLRRVAFSLSAGEVYAVHSDSEDDAALFLKALATLVAPEQGTYRFDGATVDLIDYRHSLSCKKRIAYIAPETAMLSNRTIRENLLLMRYGREDSLSIALDDDTTELCRGFDIFGKLDLKPGEIHHQNVQDAIAVRELSKAANVLLVERPEDFIDYGKIFLFVETVRARLATGLPMVYFTSDREIDTAFSGRRIVISNGRLSAG